MGTQTKKFIEIQTKRAEYQMKKTQEEMRHIAMYLSEEEKETLYSGEGFVRVPSEIIAMQRIPSYPYLVP